MAEVRETKIERDGDGHIVNTTEHIIERPKRRGGGFGWGMLLGVILIAGAIIAFAYNEGSFQSAGREADQATAQVEQQIDATTAATQQEAANLNSDTVSN
jgi:hypothetical protein